MAESRLPWRQVQKHDIPDSWKAAAESDRPFIPLQGEFIVYDDRYTSDGDDYETGTPIGLKIGDGYHNVEDLPFYGDNKVDKVAGKDLSTNDFTDELKSQYDAAYQHSLVDHAPANAQENVIETIKVNGEALEVADKAVNIVIPESTKVEASETNGNIKVDGEEVTVYTHPEKHTIAEVDGLQDALDAINDEETGVLAQAKAYIDEAILGGEW